MKRRLYINSIVIFLTFCSSLLYAQSQSSALKFNKMTHDFGIFDISDGKKNFTFKFKNEGTIPVVIQTVISSCGCTTPTWTKNPVLPGKDGEIKVEYLNDQGAYPFEKSLSVYISGNPKPIILRIRGIVKDKSFKASNSFPFHMGPLRFKTGTIDAGMVAMNITKEFEINVFNNSKSPVKVNAVNLPKGVTMKIDPNPVPAESQAGVTISIDPSKIGTFGKQKQILNFEIDGKRSSNNKLDLSFMIIDNFSGLSKEQISNAPLPVADRSSADFGEIKSGAVGQISFSIKNYGNRDFVIHKAEYTGSKIIIDYIKSIKPGQSGKVTIKTSADQVKGKINSEVSLITNSPTRPVIKFSVEGIVK